MKLIWESLLSFGLCVSLLVWSWQVGNKIDEPTAMLLMGLLVVAIAAKYRSYLKGAVPQHTIPQKPRPDDVSLTTSRSS